MNDRPTNWSALCVLVFLLGLRHGLDADHLAAIDGLTRAGTRAGRRFARWSGLSFSLGHAVVVLAVGLGVMLLVACSDLAACRAAGPARSG